MADFIKSENKEYAFLHLWKNEGLMIVKNGKVYLSHFTEKFKRRIWTEEVIIKIKGG
jgi:hypothetical protein